MADYDTLVVGGGFYGCMVATHLSTPGRRVLLVEKHAGLMQRASATNHARLHPVSCPHRGPVGGARSRPAYARFLDEFRGCIDTGFASFCAVGRASSKFTAAQLHIVCQQAGSAIEPAPEAVRRLFDPAHVEGVFRVEEAVFDAARLRSALADRLGRAKVDVALGTAAEHASGQRDGGLVVTLRSGEAMRQVSVGQVFNCSYSQLNDLLHRSGLPVVPLEHQLTEVTLVEAPAPLRRVGVTVLCGPFFSLTPFPSTPWHTLGQARYAPHAAWGELGPGGPSPHEALERAPRESGFERMRREASRYMPSLAGLVHQRSLWEVRTSPPPEREGPATLFRAHVGLRNLHCALGAGVEGIYDVLEQIDRLQRSLVAPLPRRG